MLFLSDTTVTMITETRHTQNDIVIEQQFAQIDAIINSHRNRAIANVNIENLLTCWEVGQYISFQLQYADWGNKVVADLADYLKIHNPQLRGYSRRNLYNMVKFYDSYSTAAFTSLIEKLSIKEIVQLPTAQFNIPIPSVLTITTFTNHVEIISRCRTDEERVFYMLYAAHHRLKVKQQLSLDLEKHNAQYQPIEVKQFDKVHDRFLCIDNTVYHIGASLKDLGRKWFAFSRMEMKVSELLGKVK